MLQVIMMADCFIDSFVEVEIKNIHLFDKYGRLMIAESNFASTCLFHFVDMINTRNNIFFYQPWLFVAKVRARSSHCA